MGLSIDLGFLYSKLLGLCFVAGGRSSLTFHHRQTLGDLGTQIPPVHFGNLLPLVCMVVAGLFALALHSWVLSFLLHLGGVHYD